MPHEGSKQFIEHVEATLMAMMRAELGLRRHARAQLSSFSIFPYILVANEIRAELRFNITLSDENDFLFDLFDEKDVESIADVRLLFAIHPIPEEERLPDSEPGLTFLPPPFLQNPGDVDLLSIRLISGERLQVRFPDRHRVSIQSSSGDIFTNKRIRNISLLIDLLETLAAWCKEPYAGEAKRFRIQSQELLGNLLSKIIGGYRQIHQIMRKKWSEPGLKELDRELKDIHPSFGAGYRLYSLFARIIVTLDESGKLISDLDQSERQKFDIEVSQSLNAQTTGVRINMFPPDFLVAGKHHAVFLDKLRSPEIIHRIFPKNTKLNIKEASFLDFMKDPMQDEASIFIRIRRDDLDVVLLKGQLGNQKTYMLYTMKFEVTSEPVIEVADVSDIELMALKIGSNEWQLPNKEQEAVYEYLKRLFSILRMCQKGLS
jgi:hypothetical protein